MGRTTYEDMAAVWPKSTGVYADLMNEIPKVVFSKTLALADWPESPIASGELADDIDKLKRESGGVIVAHGGATFIGSLIRENLIDEYRLVIHPVVIGNGTGPLRAPRALARHRRIRSGPAAPAGKRHLESWLGKAPQSGTLGAADPWTSPGSRPP